MTNFSSTDNSVLLEAGTNELELLVFSVANQRFGVNVAKVREILSVPKVVAVPGGHDAVEGMVMIRESVVPLVSLERCLYPVANKSMTSDDDRLLLLEFNKEYIAFRVGEVERIYRISWQDILPPPDLPCDGIPLTSIFLLGETIVPLIDFESLGVELGMKSFNAVSGDVTPVGGKDRSAHPIVYADDSLVVRELIKDRLNDAGYTNLVAFHDGQAAWEYLSDVANNSSKDDIPEKVAGVISDIEMPRMDGLSLCKKVRETPALKHLPVILFSSIASEANANKAQQVGADAQIAKPDSDQLADLLTKLLESRSA